MKHKQKFIKDITFYLSNRNRFIFTGKNVITFEYDKNGVDGITAYKLLDSNGKLVKTRHPLLAETLTKVKAAINFQIKEWAYGVAEYTVIMAELRDYLSKIYAPPWVEDAIRNQSYTLKYNYAESPPPYITKTY